MLAAFIVTTGCGYVAYTGLESNKTKILSSLLPPEVRPFFWWGLTAIGLLASLTVAWSSFCQINSSITHLELGPEEARLRSATLSVAPITIPYKSIKLIKTINMKKGQQMTIISSSVGASRIFSKFFASPSDFTTFLLTLEQRRQS